MLDTPDQSVDVPSNFSRTDWAPLGPLPRSRSPLSLQPELSRAERLYEEQNQASSVRSQLPITEVSDLPYSGKTYASHCLCKFSCGILYVGRSRPRTVSRETSSTYSRPEVRQLSGTLGRVTKLDMLILISLGYPDRASVLDIFPHRPITPGVDGG